MSKNYYVTTPIYYVNSDPHMGSAYTTIACDVLARFKRLDGYDVFFLTGTDEHGQKVAEAAAKAGKTPHEFTDFYSAKFRDLATAMNFTNTDFIRTTEPRHIQAAQAIWKKMIEAGDIYLGKHSGWYAIRDEAYYGEDEITTTPEGKKIAPSGAECTWMEEENYMFALSKWGDRLLKFYEEHPDFIAPESRRNEIISFVKSGLHDFSVSRTNFTWGVPVPGDEKHVMYVWVDALTNYITALGYPQSNAQGMEKFWPADLHMVGKDIIRFHTVYWPAMLMSAGLQPPKRVFAHGWWTVEGQKMSKSLGNAISPYDLINTYGVDGTRFVLLSLVPFGNDGDFSHDLATQKINTLLANGLGNLAQRTLSFIYKNCDGKIPQHNNLNDADLALLKSAQETMLPAVRKELDRQRFDRAIEAIFETVNAANAYIDVQAPWTLKKEGKIDRMNQVLYVLAETIRCLSLVMQPFTPAASAKLLDLLAVNPDDRGFDRISPEYALKPETSIPEPQGVFPRIITENVA